MILIYLTSIITCIPRLWIVVKRDLELYCNMIMLTLYIHTATWCPFDLLGSRLSHMTSVSAVSEEPNWGSSMKPHLIVKRLETKTGQSKNESRTETAGKDEIWSGEGRCDDNEHSSCWQPGGGDAGVKRRHLQSCSVNRKLKQSHSWWRRSR